VVHQGGLPTPFLWAGRPGEVEYLERETDSGGGSFQGDSRRISCATVGVRREKPGARRPAGHFFRWEPRTFCPSVERASIVPLAAMPDDEDSTKQPDLKGSAELARGQNGRPHSAEQNGVQAEPAPEEQVDTEFRRTSTPPESPQAKRGPKYLIWVVVVVLLALSIVLASVAIRILIHLYEPGARTPSATAGSAMPGTAGHAEERRSPLGFVMLGRRSDDGGPGTRADGGPVSEPNLPLMQTARPSAGLGSWQTMPHADESSLQAPPATSTRREPFGGPPTF
jgi:hypothetical protein